MNADYYLMAVTGLSIVLVVLLALITFW